MLICKIIILSAFYKIVVRAYLQDKRIPTMCKHKEQRSVRSICKQCTFGPYFLVNLLFPPSRSEDEAVARRDVQSSALQRAAPCAHSRTLFDLELAEAPFCGGAQDGPNATKLHRATGVTLSTPARCSRGVRLSTPSWCKLEPRFVLLVAGLGTRRLNLKARPSVP